MVIIQARTTSTRLPAKSLLPVAGYPCAVLAALRASNTNRRTIFATSDDPSDDELTAEAGKFGLEVFRGPLHDVLARYALAAAALPDDCVVVRLTADNVLPDGSFVTEMVQAFASSGVDYLGIDPKLSRMPYGLGGEAFSVAALRKADSQANASADREHVGPWMKRNCRTAVFTPRLPANENFSQFRCTIDNEEDYQRILSLFEGISNPVEIGWLDLTRKLAALPDRPVRRVSGREKSGPMHSELTLGTAQLGMEYGRVNDSGKPSGPEAVAIVRRALARGVTTFDTARGYGESETVLGEALSVSDQSSVRVITKLDLSSLNEAEADASVRRRVDDSVDSSCRALRTEKLDTLLLHRWEHRRMWGGAAWRRLLEHRQSGRVGVLGVSVYEPHEALDALRDPAIEHLQIPVNLLDWRWRAAGVDQLIMERPDVVVHARSVLLQGILAYSPERWPEIAGFDNPNCARKLSMMARKLGRESVAALCFAYVRSLPWITSLVVGCENVAQLEQNVEMFLHFKLTPEECAELEQTLPRAPEALLNPAKWKAARERTATYAS